MLVSIDPGKHKCGMAWWEDTELVTAGLVESPPLLIPEKTNHLVIEVPQIYARSKSKGDPNDLIDLAVMVGRIISICDISYTLYRPREWKGQVPKDVMVSRIKGKLSKKELERITLPAKTLQHNVFDAIGIGLKYLNRL